MVGTFNLVRKMPGGEKLVAITRILHRTTPDEVMDEIPTFRCKLWHPVQQCHATWAAQSYTASL